MRKDVIDSNALELIEKSWHVLTLSGQNRKDLLNMAIRQKELLKTLEISKFKDFVYQLNVSSSHEFEKISACVQDPKDANAELSGLIEDLKTNKTQRISFDDEKHKIAFLFTGAGAQYNKMGAQLFESSRLFRRTINEFDTILQDTMKISLLQILFDDNTCEDQINEILSTQLAVFSLEVALAELWQSWGISPLYLMGHSLGEYAAACSAGVFSKEEGIKIVGERGRLMQSLPVDVEMLTVFAEPETIDDVLGSLMQELSIAAHNATKNTVLSGKSKIITMAKECLAKHDLYSQKLAVSRAGHSTEMFPIIEQFQKMLATISFTKPNIPIISNVTGLCAGEEILTPHYWCDHLCKTVQFKKGIETLINLGTNIFLEIGPKPMLLALGRQNRPDQKTLWLASLCQGQDDWQALGNSISQLYDQGIPIKWDAFHC